MRSARRGGAILGIVCMIASAGLAADDAAPQGPTAAPEQTAQTPVQTPQPGLPTEPPPAAATQPPPAEIARLLHALEAGPFEARWTSLAALRERGAEVAPYVAPLLGSSVREARLAAAELLTAGPSEAAAPYLTWALGSDDLFLLMGVRDALNALGTAPAYRALFDATMRDPLMAAVCVQAWLAAAQPNTAFAALEPLVDPQAQDGATVRAALQALHAVDAQRAAGLARGLLSAEDRETRLLAITCAAASAESLESLRTLMSDQDPEIRRQALLAMVELRDAEAASKLADEPDAEPAWEPAAFDEVLATLSAAGLLPPAAIPHFAARWAQLTPAVQGDTLTAIGALPAEEAEPWLAMLAAPELAPITHAARLIAERRLRGPAARDALVGTLLRFEPGGCRMCAVAAADGLATLLADDAEARRAVASEELTGHLLLLLAENYLGAQGAAVGALAALGAPANQAVVDACAAVVNSDEVKRAVLRHAVPAVDRSELALELVCALLMARRGWISAEDATPCVDALGGLGSPRALAALWIFARVEVPHVKPSAERATLALGRRGAQARAEAEAEVTRLALGQGAPASSGFRMAALETLNEAQLTALRSELMAAARDPLVRPEHRAAIIGRLPEAIVTEELPGLLEMAAARDEPEGVRVAIVDRLADPAAAERLDWMLAVAASADEPEAVRVAAVKRLLTLYEQACKGEAAAISVEDAVRVREGLWALTLDAATPEGLMYQAAKVLRAPRHSAVVTSPEDDQARVTAAVTDAGRPLHARIALWGAVSFWFELGGVMLDQALAAEDGGEAATQVLGLLAAQAWGGGPAVARGVMAMGHEATARKVLADAEASPALRGAAADYLWAATGSVPADLDERVALECFAPGLSTAEKTIALKFGGSGSGGPSVAAAGAEPVGERAGDPSRPEASWERMWTVFEAALKSPHRAVRTWALEAAIPTTRAEGDLMVIQTGAANYGYTVPAPMLFPDLLTNGDIEQLADGQTAAVGWEAVGSGAKVAIEDDGNHALTVTGAADAGNGFRSEIMPAVRGPLALSGIVHPQDVMVDPTELFERDVRTGRYGFRYPPVFRSVGVRLTAWDAKGAIVACADLFALEDTLNWLAQTQWRLDNGQTLQPVPMTCNAPLRREIRVTVPDTAQTMQVSVFLQNTTGTLCVDDLRVRPALPDPRWQDANWSLKAFAAANGEVWAAWFAEIMRRALDAGNCELALFYGAAFDPAPPQGNRNEELQLEPTPEALAQLARLADYELRGPVANAAAGLVVRVMDTDAALHADAAAREALGRAAARLLYQVACGEMIGTGAAPSAAGPPAASGAAGPETLARARQHLARALELLPGTGEELLRAELHAALYLASVVAGSPDQAAREQTIASLRAVPLTDMTPHQFDSFESLCAWLGVGLAPPTEAMAGADPEVLLAHARLVHESGDFARAAELYQAALGGTQRVTTEVWAHLGLAALDRQWRLNVSSALEHCRQAEALVEALTASRPFAQARLEEERAACYEWLGQPQVAAEHYEAASAAALETNAAGEIARTATGVARAYRANGRPGPALVALIEALARLQGSQSIADFIAPAGIYLEIARLCEEGGVPDLSERALGRKQMDRLRRSCSALRDATISGGRWQMSSLAQVLAFADYPDRLAQLQSYSVALALTAVDGYAQRLGLPELAAESGLLRARSRRQHAPIQADVALSALAAGLDEARPIMRTAHELVRPELAWRAHSARAADCTAARESLLLWLAAQAQPDASAAALADRLARQASYELGAAAEIVEGVRARLPSSRTRALFMQQARAQVYADMVEVQLALGDPVAALEWAERGKARSFLDTMGDRRPAAPPAADEQLAREEEGLRAEIDALRAQLAQVPEEGQRGTRIERSAALVERSERYAQVLEQLGQASPELAAAVVVAPRPVADVQALLGDGEVIIEYFAAPTSDSKPLAWAITADTVSWRRLEIARSDLDEQVRLFRQLLAQPGTPYPEALGRRLYEVLLAPFAETLASADLLCVVPHGSLHYLPFHALDDGSGYVIGRWPVSYAPSANALLLCRAQNAGRRATVEILAGPEPAEALPPLRYAAAEAQAIAARFADSGVLLGADASEAAVRTAVGRDVVHFATHGEMNPWAPLLSCLHLSPAAGSDGRLEVHEIFDLHLDASLVTLSACETALGDLTSGDDMIGLSRAFMYAGTPSVVASLWRVDDEATATLMGDFYGALATEDKTRSLRAAQIAAIEAGAHPYYWAPFEVLGDWR